MVNTGIVAGIHKVVIEEKKEEKKETKKKVKKRK